MNDERLTIWELLAGFALVGILTGVLCWSLWTLPEHPPYPEGGLVLAPGGKCDPAVSPFLTGEGVEWRCTPQGWEPSGR